MNLCTCLAMPSRKKVELLTFLLVFGSCEDAMASLGHILKCFQAPSLGVIGDAMNILNPYSILVGTSQPLFFLTLG